MIFLVCGQGRCGSSLTMQMLTQGGFDHGNHPECIWPSFEDPRATRDPGGSWVSDYEGKVLKVLSPGDYPPVLRSAPSHPSLESSRPALESSHPALEFRAIWLDRAIKEQARSWLKIQQARHGRRGDLGAVKYKLKKDRKRHLSALRRLTGDILFLRFEEIIKDPERWCRRIADFVGPDFGGPLDVDRMVEVVIPRKAECVPGIMERALARVGPPS